MLITSKGYNLKFIQTNTINDTTDHLKSIIYKFHSPKTKLNYVLTADLHENDGSSNILGEAIKLRI